MKGPPPRRERVNDDIRMREVQVIDHQGVNRGDMPTEEAMELARSVGMDLVEINPAQRPPLCRIMDYGQFRYDKSKKEHRAQKHQHQIKIKEIRMRPKTGEGDLKVKIDRARAFLKSGNKVQAYIQFRGREIVHRDVGLAKLQKLIDEVEDIGELEGEINPQGHRIFAMIAPKRRVLNQLREKQRLREVELQRQKSERRAAALSPEEREARERAAALEAKRKAVEAQQRQRAKKEPEPEPEPESGPGPEPEPDKKKKKKA